MSGVSVKNRIKLYKRDGGKCHYCERELVIELGATTKTISKNRMTVEHIVPKAFGGSNHLWNLLACCPGCNGTRGCRLYECLCSTCVGAYMIHNQNTKKSKRIDIDIRKVPA